jgi:hypothetical protein
MKTVHIILSILCLGISQISFAQTKSESMNELVEQLRAKRELTLKWAPLCEDGTQSHNLCPFHDMAIFSGMSCLSGQVERCEDVRRAQGPDGRWWRSPQLVGNDEEISTFSRDQAKGVLAYLVATKDVAAAVRWQTYLDSHKQKMCPKSDNNRCTITAGTSRLFGAVWEYLGLKPAKWMNRGERISAYYNQIEARYQPDNFPMHLNALNAWVRLEIERRGGPKAQEVDGKVIKELVRREPENPFFLILREGPTEKVAKIILEKCPDQRPLGPDRLDWAWQRGQEGQPWLRASGHECTFMINVFEKELSLLR